MREAMARNIIVINPNSTTRVTAGIDAAVDALRIPGGPGIECVTLQAGPPGVESQRDADAVIQPLLDYVHTRDNDADAFVIACYSDPGLHSAREASAHPVFGIAECGLMAALTRGERFGVLSILAKSVPRHLRYVRALGIDSRMAADLPIGLGIAELGDDARVMEHMITVGERLRDEHLADVLVMGCAGMARFRDRLEDAVGLPVIEPTQAAVTMALGAVCLGQRGRAH
jgi:Asp/Glu/hydantoin racemase